MSDHPPSTIDASINPSGYIVSHRGYEHSMTYGQSISSYVTVAGLNHAEGDVIVLQVDNFHLPAVRWSHSQRRNVCDDYFWIAGAFFCGFGFSERSSAVTTDTFQLGFVTDNNPGNNRAGFKLKYTGKTTNNKLV